MARRRTAIVLDDRTQTMSDAALICRADGHVWQRVPVSQQRLRKIISESGVVEKRWVCLCCGAEKCALFDASTLEPHGHSVIDYRDETYLLKNNSGQGRLPRREAAKADLTRSYPGLF